MTLDEAIRNAEEVAEQQEKTIEAKNGKLPKSYCECAEEHRQLAEWLKDYKRLLEQQPCTDAISRSEAIRIASGYCHWTNIPDELAKLPSANPKPCEDAISRELTLHEITLIAKVKAKSDAQKKLMGRCMFVIEHMPSVNPQKTGRWIEHNDDHYDWYECSECEYGADGEITTEHGVIFNYCPNCGAKMEGVE